MSYSTLQRDQLQKIGANLQETRLAQEKSIDDISVQTYIRPQLIRAIESGQVDDLPQPIFVQGFIRRYAEALGLDGMSLSKQFPVHSIPDTPRPYPQPAAKPVPFGSDALVNPVITNGPVRSRAVPAAPMANRPLPEVPSASERVSDTAPVGNPPAAELDPRTVGSGVVSPVLSSSVPSDRSLQTASSGPGAMPYVLAGVLAVGILGAIALLMTLAGGDPRPQQAELEPAPELEAAPAPEPEAAPAPEPAAASPSAGSDAPVAVSVSLSGDSWMSVRVDGVSAYEGIMTSGSEELWEGNESIFVSVGNAGAVEVSANGTAPQVAGPPGAVRNFTFTPNQP